MGVILQVTMLLTTINQSIVNRFWALCGNPPPPLDIVSKLPPPPQRYYELESSPTKRIELSKTLTTTKTFRFQEARNSVVV